MNKLLHLFWSEQKRKIESEKIRISFHGRPPDHASSKAQTKVHCFKFVELRTISVYRTV